MQFSYPNLMLNKSTIILLFGIVMGCIVGGLDIFQIRNKNYFSDSTKDSQSKQKLEFLKRSSLSKRKKEQTSSINNLKNFLLEYKSLSPKDAGNTLLEQSENSSSELYKFNILSYLAFQLGKASTEDIGLLLDEWGDRAPQADLAEGLIKGWAKTDWDGAIMYLLSHRDKSYSENAFQLIVKDRAQFAPEATIKWLSSQSEEIRSAGLMPVIQGVAENNPELVSLFISSTLQPGDLNDVYLLNIVASTFPKSDWTTALKWFNSLDSITKQEYASSAYAAFAEADYSRATEEFLKAGDEKFAHAVVAVLIKRSPVKAMQWVGQNIKEDKNSYFSLIAGSNVAQTSEFAEYVAQMPTGETRDAAVYAMMLQRSRMSDNLIFTMEDTLSLVSSISNENLKIRAIGNSLDIWIQKHPEKVLEWVKKTSHLSQESKMVYIQRCDSSIKKNISR